MGRCFGPVFLEALGPTHGLMTPADTTLSAGVRYSPIFRKPPLEETMKFASVRLIATDMKAMVAFYELVTGQAADWLAPQFAEIVTPAATLAIGSAETVAAFAEGSAKPGANRTAILEFMVDDIDAVFDRLMAKPNRCMSPS